MISVRVQERERERVGNRRREWKKDMKKESHAPGGALLNRFVT